MHWHGDLHLPIVVLERLRWLIFLICNQKENSTPSIVDKWIQFRAHNCKSLAHIWPVCHEPATLSLDSVAFPRAEVLWWEWKAPIAEWNVKRVYRAEYTDERACTCPKNVCALTRMRSAYRCGFQFVVTARATETRHRGSEPFISLSPRRDALRGFPPRLHTLEEVHTMLQHPRGACMSLSAPYVYGAVKRHTCRLACSLILRYGLTLGSMYTSETSTIRGEASLYRCASLPRDILSPHGIHPKLTRSPGLFRAIQLRIRELQNRPDLAKGREAKLSNGTPHWARCTK